MTTTALAFENVTKTFGSLTAVNALSFAVPEGGVFGFLGGNGAGKTTSLRMALDILRPTRGQISVLGSAPSRENAGDIGFLPEERGLYRGMTLLDTIIYFGRIKGMAPAAARKAAMELIARLDLQGREKTTIEKLSKGLSQKVQLATALVNKPRLLLLDEPFSGLDPVNQGVLEGVIGELAKQGSTILFSTHVMQHAERLCQQLMLLSRGRKVFEGTQEDARATLPSRLTLTARSDPAGLPGVSSTARLGDAEPGWSSYQVELKPDTKPGDLLEICTAQGFALRAFDIHKATLHEAFVHIVGADLETGK